MPRALFLIFSFIILLVFPIERAQPKTNKVEETRSRIKSVTCELIQSHFSDLMAETKTLTKRLRKKNSWCKDSEKTLAYDLEITSYVHPKNFINAFVWATLRKPQKRSYQLRFHPDRITEMDPEMPLLTAALARELFRLQNYTQTKKRSFFGPMIFHVSDGMSEKSKKQLISRERALDQKVVDLGLGKQLIAYRKWQSVIVPSEDWNTMTQTQLSEQEILRSEP
ncbi:MAG: hypothetical protein KDD52_06320 [Bdellovibrionales bacterium]|nr:hypothetical protein [Bdellovibrionales bacterium]